MEQLRNNATTTLNGSITNSTTSIVVTDGSVFPSSGNFRIKIDNELITVTSRSTNTLTVTRGVESTTAVSHADLASVNHVLTAAAIDTVLDDLYQIGAYASRPSSGIRSGTIYRANDIDLGWRYNGTNWDLVHPVYVPNSRKIDFTSGWTQLNFGSTTYTDVNGVAILNLTFEGTFNARGYTKSLPTPPYKLNLLIRPTYDNGGSNVISSVGVYDGTKLQTMGYGASSALTTIMRKYTNTTTSSSTITRATCCNAPYMWLRFEDNNTNNICSYSFNGLNYITFLSQARNTFLTPTNVALALHNQQTSSLPVEFMLYGYWEE